MSHKLRLNDFSSTTDTNKRDAAVANSISPNWKYAFATLALCMAIAKRCCKQNALPQVSKWVESQYPIRLLQQTKPKNTAFPTTKGIPITSGFGWRIHPLTGEYRFHSGIDFGAPQGTPIYAFKAGLVEFAGIRGGYGKAVIINHGAGKSTLYGHASKLIVRKGERVVPGQIVGKIGSTGNSTGPHLHFEVRLDDKPVNPRPYLQQAGR
ncbi:MAG: M23 family metallopeptidase [Rivularia sp. (in: cyanobacteria)]